MNVPLALYNDVGNLFEEFLTPTELYTMSYVSSVTRDGPKAIRFRQIASWISEHLVELKTIPLRNIECPFPILELYDVCEALFKNHKLDSYILLLFRIEALDNNIVKDILTDELITYDDNKITDLSYQMTIRLNGDLIFHVANILMAKQKNNLLYRIISGSKYLIDPVVVRTYYNIHEYLYQGFNDEGLGSRGLSKELEGLGTGTTANLLELTKIAIKIKDKDNYIAYLKKYLVRPDETYITYMYDNYNLVNHETISALLKQSGGHKR